MEEVGPSGSSAYCCASPISSTSRHASNSSTDDHSTSSDLLSGHSSQPLSPIPSSSSNNKDGVVRKEQREYGKDLREHNWYWGAASKEQISAAMENQSNGTFSIRDASTKGQFTLTLRIDGTNKLIKIMVEKAKCGFTPDCLDFDSIADLVQFYRTCSLRDFNERLDTCLLNPLISPDWQARQQQGIGEGGKSKSKMLDQGYRNNLLKCRLEGLHAEYDRVSRRYDQLFSQQSALADEHKRKQQTSKAYSDALKIFHRKIGELKKSKSEHMDLAVHDKEALTMNIELQEERMEEIGKAQSLMQNAIQNIGQTLIKIDEELEELKPKLLKLHRKRDKCRDKLLSIKPNRQQQMITHAQLDRIVQGVSIALDAEPISLSAFLLRTPLGMPKWDCENWLWHSATKEQSSAFIKALLKDNKADGIFLIRPSTSRPGFYALEISKDGNVHSCLIEYRDSRNAPIDHNGGYGFAQTQMLFASLADFVRYYSVVPLKEHNAVLDTPLITPALGLHKKAERKKNAGECADKNEKNAKEAIKMGKGNEGGKSPAPPPSSFTKSPPSSNSSMSKK